MALNIFTGSTTRNWSATSSWSLGRIPTATDLDTAYFGPLSPTCSIDVVSAPCYNFDSSTYTRELTFNQNLLIYGTYSNFGGGSFRFTTTNNALPGSLLRIEATCSITSNNFVISSGYITFAQSNNSYTITLLDQLTVDNTYFLRSTGTPTITINGATLSIRSSFNITQNINLRGTSNIELKGTASTTATTFNMFSTNPLTNNVYINTPGSVNISTYAVLPNNNIFKWISGSLSITNFFIAPNNNAIGFTYDNSSNTLITNLSFLQGSNGINGTVSAIYPFNATTINIIGGPGGGSVNSWWLYGGFSCSSFSFINSNANSRNNLYLSPSASYYINSSATIQVGAPYNAPTYTSIYSTTNGVKAPLIISYAATQSIFNIQFTDIDASGGATILPYQYNATFSNVSNIQDLKAYYIMTNQIQIN